MTKKSPKAPTTPQPVYTLLIEMYKGYFDPRFAFHASDDADALNKAHSWALYQGMSCQDVNVRVATAQEATHWLHDDYLR